MRQTVVEPWNAVTAEWFVLLPELYFLTHLSDALFTARSMVLGNNFVARLQALAIAVFLPCHTQTFFLLNQHYLF